jgi:hypothetical protein
MSKTTKTTPGLRRLRASLKAETIRAAVLADQRKGRAEARAKIAAAKAPKTAAAAPRARRAPKARANAERPASKAAKATGKHAAMLASAQAGKLPAPPDFTAETHKRFRSKLAEVAALAKAGDAKALAAWEHKGFMGSSMRAVMRYRDLALVALEAHARQADAA